MKVLILGSSGQLGRCLKDQLKNTFYDITFTTREEINIADLDKTRTKIKDLSPNIIINASAFTAVDKAEEQPELANLINNLAVKNISNICNDLDCWLIHISTDYVFDGNSIKPYNEKNRTNPQSVYGKTKLDGELAIESSGCKYIIIRTAWLFSEYGTNFLKTIFQKSFESKELSVVNDQIGCPTYAQDLASVIVAIMPKLEFSKKFIGTYHYSGNSNCSWFEFADEIFNQFKKLNNVTFPALKQISTEKFPTLAKRPKFSALDSNKFQSTFNLQPSDWKQGIVSSLKSLM